MKTRYSEVTQAALEEARKPFIAPFDHIHAAHAGLQQTIRNRSRVVEGDGRNARPFRLSNRDYLQIVSTRTVQGATAKIALALTRTASTERNSAGMMFGVESKSLTLTVRVYLRQRGDTGLKRR